jgi:hypothetical protein
MAKMVNGRVVDYTDSGPLVGVSVVAVQPPFGIPYSATTDDSGVFSLDLPFDTVGWQVTFTLAGYSSVTVDISTLFSGNGVAMVPVNYVAPPAGGGGSTGSGTGGGAGAGAGAGAGSGGITNPLTNLLPGTTFGLPNYVVFAGFVFLYTVLFHKKRR